MEKSKPLSELFDLEDRYQILGEIGKGAYGIVCAANDTVLEEPVAIKKILDAFEHMTTAKRTLREIKLLHMLKHENTIAIDRILKPMSGEFDDIYIISELMETDLASILKSPQQLTEHHCQFFLYQLLRGLKYIHSCGIIHRDLKPRNLLVNSNCDLKICDFGLARVEFGDNDKRRRHSSAAMTDYVATRWYRAPEVLMCCGQYSKPIDMWSVGCIFGEMIHRRPLFPGSDSKNQLLLLVETLGSLPQHMIDTTRYQQIRDFMEQLPAYAATPFDHLFPDLQPDALDLLRGLLAMDPAKRLTADQALRHPYLAALHFPQDEPSGFSIPPKDFAFELQDLEMWQMKELMSAEIEAYEEEYAQQCLNAEAEAAAETSAGGGGEQQAAAAVEEREDDTAGSEGVEEGRVHVGQEPQFASTATQPSTAAPAAAAAAAARAGDGQPAAAAAASRQQRADPSAQAATQAAAQVVATGRVGAVAGATAVQVKRGGAIVADASSQEVVRQMQQQPQAAGRSRAPDAAAHTSGTKSVTDPSARKEREGETAEDAAALNGQDEGTEASDLLSGGEEEPNTGSSRLGRWIRRLGSNGRQRFSKGNVGVDKVSTSQREDELAGAEGVVSRGRRSGSRGRSMRTTDTSLTRDFRTTRSANNRSSDRRVGTDRTEALSEADGQKMR